MKKKPKLKDEVKFKANSLQDGIIVDVPDEDTILYKIEFASGNTIRCTEHYFEVIQSG